ncbi:SulP family sulfate permease [Teratosphaeria destructans]|uniref:SulP family sulfate permease n=1 Tax=Teratosphaeria destructans TaxID=418781 RepID=A0A9W7SZE5_9PEZI|nr:SulP family sulfate permease [Teratosphaeria destructans]
MLWDQTCHFVKSDPNVRNFLRFAKHHGPNLPRHMTNYLISKLPIVKWLPSYSPVWLFNDILAGITVGVLLVPQSLSYATIAKLPPSYGLISSWIPTLFYAVMGTSKDLTAGPTAIMGLLTGEVIEDLTGEGYSAIAIASAAAFWTGIYASILGLFRLGFLLDFIPLPVLSGYVSGSAITIILNQLHELFGEAKSGISSADKIKYFFTELPNTNWRAFLIGASGIVMLIALQEMGRRLGARYKGLWFIAMARNALALVLFTSISYGVNKDLVKPLFPVAEVSSAAVFPPSVLDTALLRKTAGSSLAVFVAAALEHLAIGKAFGRRHGYEIDQDQELNYVGAINLFQSFFSCMPVTGGFSRTAVNSEAGVKSPLSGLVVSACVLISIYAFTDAFYWIPKATLSAIIVVAVWQIIVPPRVFWHYWKMSFLDFAGAMFAFWVVLFVNVEIGIFAGVCLSMACLLLQLAFPRVTLVTSANIADYYPHGNIESFLPQANKRFTLRSDMMVFVLQDAILFPNAARVAKEITRQIYVYSMSANEHFQCGSKDKDRLWNDSRGKMVETLRRQAGITSDSFLPCIALVVLDMTRVSHIDTTGMQALADIRSSLKEWSGEDAELRFTGLNEDVKERFSRAAEMYDLHQVNDRGKDAGRTVFNALQRPLRAEHESDARKDFAIESISV